MSAETSAAHCSAMLKATTTTGSLNWPVMRSREDGFKSGLSDVGLAPDTTTVSEIVGDQIEGLTNAVRHYRWSPHWMHTHLPP
jgi:hypothetical protein